MNEQITKERRKHMPNLSKEEQAEVVERAIQKWMDKQWSKIGKSIVAVVAVGLFVAACRWLFAHGWNPS